MTTKTLTLAEFLLARISEDEAAFARIAPAQEDRWFDREGNKAAVQINASLRRWSRELEAKRRIVEGMQPYGPIDDISAPEILGLLALPYADHPDYSDAWRP